MLIRISILTAALTAALTTSVVAFPVNFGPGFKTRTATVDGCTISATIGGRGPAIVLFHGYAEDSRMWKPLAVSLASRFTVIAPDLPGIGNSSIPSSGLDMTTSARRIHDAIAVFGYHDARVVGHDIGLMVAYAYAATYRNEVKKLVLMDAFLPGVAGWQAVYDTPTLWHFRFVGPTPLALVSGRESTYFNYFWDDFAADKNRSLSENSRREYIAAYSRPGRMASGWTYFAAFPKTASDFAALAKTRLTIPVLSIGGDKSLGSALGAQAKLVASDVTVVVLKDTGHWLIEESPAETMAAITRFLERP
ncbi:MAG: alpha/beta hydrolase [Candidatus Eremiobacteraeota bacterium]|nr:alpha/beta hydrolase [Candidatus Eremiobacteraeota bacterium]